MSHTGFAVANVLFVEFGIASGLHLASSSSKTAVGRIATVATTGACAGFRAVHGG